MPTESAWPLSLDQAALLVEEGRRVHSEDVGPLFGQAAWLIEHPGMEEQPPGWMAAINLALTAGEGSRRS